MERVTQGVVVGAGRATYRKFLYKIRKHVIHIFYVEHPHLDLVKFDACASVIHLAIVYTEAIDFRAGTEFHTNPIPWGAHEKYCSLWDPIAWSVIGAGQARTQMIARTVKMCNEPRGKHGTQDVQ